MMMNTPLTLRQLFERPVEYFPDKTLVSRTSQGRFRYCYRDFNQRVNQLAYGLRDMGIKPGDHVAVMAWNTFRHLELYFAIPLIGGIIHMVNFRLFPEQLTYILNHAEDIALFVEDGLASIVTPLVPQLPTVTQYVVMGDGYAPEIPGAIDYETLLTGQPNEFPYPDLDETSACGLCYTSATTGRPKGVHYTHRALYLHSLTLCAADVLAMSERDVVMPVVPMFHVNGWGLPYSAAWVGASQVLPGPHPTPMDIVQLIGEEYVTIAAAVPTVWFGIEQLLAQDASLNLKSLRTVPMGGSAVPRSFIQRMEQDWGIPIAHAYGMTETTPLATYGYVKSAIAQMDEPTRYDYRAKQGIPIPGMRMRVARTDGQEVRHDGQEMGEIWLQAPWVADEYYHDDRSSTTFVDGWFHTGDIATIDSEGYLRLIDRTKDLIKSGGEWISSVELENALMGHPAVAEAAVIAVPDPHWMERPLACVVLKPDAGGEVTEEALLAFIAPHFARFWLPDTIVFLEEIPKTSTGKFSKVRLREWYHQGDLGTPRTNSF